MTEITVKIVVTGGTKVGKSALVVRYLTGRFINEYISDKDCLYADTISTDEDVTNLEILDCSSFKVDVKHLDYAMSWADAFIIVYSIEDKLSFDIIPEFVKYIKGCKAPAYVPVSIIGTKSDLAHLRKVTQLNGEEISLRYGCQFHEVSSADDTDNKLVQAVRALAREARSMVKLKDRRKNKRRESVARESVVSKAFTSMYHK